MRAKKRKREEGEDDDDYASGIEGIEAEQPKQGIKRLSQKQKKKEKEKQVTKRNEGKDESNGVTKAPEHTTTEEPTEKSKKIKAQEKRDRKQQKKAKKADKESRRLNKQAEPDKVEPAHVEELYGKADEQLGEDEQGVGEIVGFNEDRTTAKEEQLPSQSSVSPTPELGSPGFDQSNAQSVASSTTSIVPATTCEKPKKPLVDSETLRVRLQARLEELRAARKADGPDGMRARNRQELMEARRKKEEQRRAHKRELRLKAKEEERLGRDRTSIFSSSPGLNSPLRTPAIGAENNFSFGRIAFNDGQHMDANLSTLLDQRPAKGPQDPLGAMKAAESKRARLNGFDEGKRKDIEEKDLWLNARKRIHGEKVRDDMSLLKKTLKRQEKGKKKSEFEWEERLAGVEKGKEMRQKKREDNLRKRRDEKGGKGKKKGGKPQKRPGFEGSFRAKPGPKRT